MESKKMFTHDRAISIFCIGFIIILFITSLVFVLLGINNKTFLIVGCVLIVPSVAIMLIVFFGKSLLNIATFSTTDIKLSSVFGKTVRKKHLNDLKKIELNYLIGTRHNSYYICLCFSEDEINTHSFNELLQNDDIILIAYSKEKLDIIKSFTNIPIIEN